MPITIEIEGRQRRQSPPKLATYVNFKLMLHLTIHWKKAIPHKAKCRCISVS